MSKETGNIFTKAYRYIEYHPMRTVGVAGDFGIAMGTISLINESGHHLIMPILNIITGVACNGLAIARRRQMKQEEPHVRKYRSLRAP